MNQSDRNFAKRKFGQNFLVNPQMQSKITDRFKSFVSRLYPSYKIVEIGPGRGDLSKYLFEYGERFTMMEIDWDAAQYINSQYDIGKSKLINVDAYKELEIEGKIYPEKFILFSNLPFNVGSRILVDLAIYYPDTPFGVILQKEVATKVRMDNDITFFGSWLNLHWSISHRFDISKGNFSPMPKVTSAYIEAVPKNINFSKSERSRLKDMLKSLFAMPNKTVSNNLKKMGWDSTKLDRFYDSFNYEKNLRLSWDNYEKLLIDIMNYDKKN